MGWQGRVDTHIKMDGQYNKQEVVAWISSVTWITSRRVGQSLSLVFRVRVVVVVGMCYESPPTRVSSNRGSGGRRESPMPTKPWGQPLHFPLLMKPRGQLPHPPPSYLYDAIAVTYCHLPQTEIPTRPSMQNQQAQVLIFFPTRTSPGQSMTPTWFPNSQLTPIWLLITTAIQ